MLAAGIVLTVIGVLAAVLVLFMIIGAAAIMLIKS